MAFAERSTWEDLQADVSERACALGVSSEDDVERLVDEVRESLADESKTMTECFPLRQQER